MLARRLFCLSGLLLGLLACLGTQAHEFRSPRATHLRIGPGWLKVEVRYDLSPGTFAEELRSRFDADGNRRLSPLEQQRLIGWMRQAATHFLRLELDERALSLRLQEEKVSPLGRPLPDPGAIFGTFAFQTSLPRAAPGRSQWLSAVDREKSGRWPVSFSMGGEKGCELLEGAVTGPQGRRNLPLPLPSGVPVLQGVGLEAHERLLVRIACH